MVSLLSIVKGIFAEQVLQKAMYFVVVGFRRYQRSAVLVAGRCIVAFYRTATRPVRF